VAEEYERVRPSYPKALVGDACSRAGLNAGDTVVEIGCGTGKLTRTLVDQGLRVEAVEPDANLIGVARQVVPEGSVRFFNATFEDAEVPGTFRAVFAATSFHWIDPAVGWRKVASLLEPAGVLALLSHMGGMQGELDRELIGVWHEVVPESADRWKPLDDEALWRGAESRLGNVSELWSWLSYHDLARPEAAELFTDVELVREPFDLDVPTEEYLARLRTSNYYLHLSREKQRRLDDGLRAVIDRYGAVYPSRSFATLVTARRTG
jgi:SAM-dependent methyltransferase